MNKDQYHVYHLNKLAVALLTVVALSRGQSVEATTGGVLTCNPNSSCSVGEFLYDDEYAPISTATCTMYVKKPDNTVLYNNVNMSGGADGYYKYDFTAPTDLGFYPTQICCTAGTDYLCLDKSFAVSDNPATLDSNAVAGAVWNAQRSTYATAGTFGEGVNTPTLTQQEIEDAVWDADQADHTTAGSFGLISSAISINSDQIASAVWSYSDRSLSAFSNLISSIWSDPNRTVSSVTGTVNSVLNLSGTSSSVTLVNGDGILAQLTKLSKKMDYSVEMLDKLVNEPIIQTNIEEIEFVDLSEKLDKSWKKLALISKTSSQTRNSVEMLRTNWSKTSYTQLNSQLKQIKNDLGSVGDESDKDNLVGNVAWFEEYWGFEESVVLGNTVREAVKLAGQLEEATKQGDKSDKTKAMLSELSDLLDIDSMVSKNSDEQNLYARLKKVEKLAEEIDVRQKEAENLLSEMKTKDARGLSNKAVLLASMTEGLNTIPGSRFDLSVATNNDYPFAKNLKNLVLKSRGVLAANIRYLASKPGKIVGTGWMEEGSMVFNTVVTNTSELSSRQVPVKINLPIEVSEEDVLEVDDNLKLKFDSERNGYYVEGVVELEPSESTTLSVRVEDVWQLPTNEIESTIAQVDSLVGSLVNATVYPQAVSLGGDIKLHLEKALSNLDAAVTPEQKIKSYRESLLEIKAADEKMVKLKEMVGGASTTNSLLGFVGGAQATATWGVVVVVVAGFVFLAVYLNTLRKGVQTGVPGQGSLSFGFDRVVVSKTKSKKVITAERSNGRLIMSVIMVFAVGGVFARQMSNGFVLGATENTSSEIAENKVVAQEVKPEEKATGGLDFILIDGKSKEVKVYDGPSEDANVVSVVGVLVEAVRLGSENGYDLIKIGNGYEADMVPTGYVLQENIKSAEEILESGAGDLSVLILETPTGWLRVRSNPSGDEVDRINPGEIYTVLEQSGDWYRIELNENETGWIASEYAETIE